MSQYDQKVNIKLVGEVEKRQMLYNSMIPEYSRKDLTEKAWSEVAAEVNMTVPEVKEKWRNLRSVFVRHMKPYFTGSTQKQKKPYYLSEAMQFTLPFIKSTRLQAGYQLYTKDDDEEEEQYEEYIEEGTPLDRLASLLPTAEPPATSETEDVPPVPSPLPKPRSTTSKRTLDEVEETLLDYVRAKKEKLDSTSNGNISSRREGMKVFLMSLLPEFDVMTDSEVRQFKIKALQVIEEIVSSK